MFFGFGPSKIYSIPNSKAVRVSYKLMPKWLIFSDMIVRVGNRSDINGINLELVTTVLISDWGYIDYLYVRSIFQRKLATHFLSSGIMLKYFLLTFHFYLHD